MDNQTFMEQLLYDEAKKWLNENGDFKNTFTFIKDRSVIRLQFTKNEVLTTLEGDDLKTMTIQLYNEVKQVMKRSKVKEMFKRTMGV